MDNGSALFREFAGKNVLFITTKNMDYIRNVQEIERLKESAQSLSVLGSNEKSYIKRLVYVFSRLLFMPLKKFDTVFAGFAPQLVLPFFRRRFRGKFIAEDFFISLYDTFVCDRKKVRKDSWAANVLHKLDQKTLMAGNMIIADTKAHRDYFTGEFGAEPDKMRVLYLEADRNIYYPRKTEKTPEDRDKFTVLYFGSILPLQGVETILDCINLMKEYHNILFDVIGPVNADKGRFEGCNVRFTPWLRQEELAERIAKADLCLAGHFNPDIGKASRTIPGKAYIYEAMEKPMILGDNSANRELFSEDGSRHFFVAMGDASALRDKICRVSEKLGFTLKNN